MCTRHTSRSDACERPYGLRLTSHPIPRAGGASEQKRGRSVRAFGKDRAPETKAPARSITAAVPTPLGPPVGCHPTPSDGIAHANRSTGSSVGKGLTPKPCRLFFSGIAISRFRFPCPPTPAATGPGHSAVRRGPRATPQELRSAKLDHRATTYPLLLSVDARRRRPKEGGAPEPSRRVLKDPSLP